MKYSFHPQRETVLLQEDESIYSNQKCNKYIKQRLGSSTQLMVNNLPLYNMGAPVRHTAQYMSGQPWRPIQSQLPKLTSSAVSTKEMLCIGIST